MLFSLEREWMVSCFFLAFKDHVIWICWASSIISLTANSNLCPGQAVSNVPFPTRLLWVWSSCPLPAIMPPIPVCCFLEVQAQDLTCKDPRGFLGPPFELWAQSPKSILRSESSDGNLTVNSCVHTIMNSQMDLSASRSSMIPLWSLWAHFLLCHGHNQLLTGPQDCVKMR